MSFVSDIPIAPVRPALFLAYTRPLQAVLEQIAKITKDEPIAKLCRPQTGNFLMVTSSSLFNLQGHIALITGSSQGIGFALARGLAEHGATVIINGRDRSKMDKAVALLNDEGHTVFSSAFDVT